MIKQAILTLILVALLVFLLIKLAKWVESVTYAKKQLSGHRDFWDWFFLVAWMLAAYSGSNLIWYLLFNYFK